MTTRMNQEKVKRGRESFRKWMAGLEDKPMVPPPMTVPENKRKQPDYREEQLKLW